MILGKRILSAIHLVVLAGLVGVSATTAQTISVTDASAAPALVAPGDRVTIAVSLTNSHPTTAWAAGGTVDAIITFTHTVTGTSFPLSGTAVTSADIDGDGGTGTATFSGTVPTQTTESGNYRYSIEISNPTGGGNFSWVGFFKFNIFVHPGADHSRTAGSEDHQSHLSRGHQLRGWRHHSDVVNLRE